MSRKSGCQQKQQEKQNVCPSTLSWAFGWNNLPTFHAVTGSGCDTTSHFAGYGKEESLWCFCENFTLLGGSGLWNLFGWETITQAEQFMINL